ncbi:hypothetical protein [Brevundimonas diminuta]|jgi:hypothetical protein|uniref:hypothetical protein n=1 Tax=Brevundimonas diminuta TaxID=293 RepID=UPI003F7EE698
MEPTPFSEPRAPTTRAISFDWVMQKAEAFLEEVFRATQYALVVGLIAYAAYRANDPRTDLLALAARFALSAWLILRCANLLGRVPNLNQIRGFGTIWRAAALMSAILVINVVLGILNEVVFAGMAAAL